MVRTGPLRVLTVVCVTWMCVVAVHVASVCTRAAMLDRALADAQLALLQRLPANVTGINVIYQLPLLVAPGREPQNGEDVRLAQRQAEYISSVSRTLQHDAVSSVHLLLEREDQVAVVRDCFHGGGHLHKLRVHAIHKRMHYADAVAYANTHLGGHVVALSTADTAVEGRAWHALSSAAVASHLLALTRHEQPGCAMTCDCRRKFDTCYDTFVFRAPLGGGPALLRNIDFRMGGLWGSENRFLWEVMQRNPTLLLSNPCYTFVMRHAHCVDGGHFRPSQDAHRINGDGKSLSPNPRNWTESLNEAAIIAAHSNPQRSDDVSLIETTTQQ